MDIKVGLEVSTQDFWYDLTEGYLEAEEICANKEDAEKVKQAVTVLEDFRESCEDKIEGFIQ